MSQSAAEPARDAGSPQPSFPRIRRIDDAWYRGEKWLCGVLFLFMAVIVFLSVLRDVFGTRHQWIDAVVLFFLLWAGATTRVRKDGEKKRSHLVNAGLALGVTIVVGGLVELYVQALPGGLIWGPKMALCLMLWVAFLGASMTTYEKAHLALEAGDKIWPQKIRRYVKAFAHALTSAFCMLLFVLSIISLARHYDHWSAAGGHGDTVPTLDWLPSWVVFLVFPYVFLGMAVRIMAQAVTVATGTEVAAEGGEPR
ncbi:MAG: TRAP transporter small permease subunit [Myxococcota bacterium]